MRNENAFGELLKQMIKDSGMTQVQFYSGIGITKPYFYDMLSGRINPPPRELQKKAIDILNPTPERAKEFYDLAAIGRGELPTDIYDAAYDNPEMIRKIRELIGSR